MAQVLTFVNYGADAASENASRHTVSVHIGKYHRNRSKPSRLRSRTASQLETDASSARRLNTAAKRRLTTNAAAPTTQPLPLPPTTATVMDTRFMPLNQCINRQIEPQQHDPFLTGIVPMTYRTQPAITHYFTAIMPVVEPVVKERHEYQQWLFPLIMSETALFYALVGCMAHNIEQISRRGPTVFQTASMFAERRQYKVRAMMALNASISDPARAVSPATMMTVHFLLWQEIFTGDECVRLEHIKTLLEFRGGFVGMQRKAIEAITVGSFWRAIRTRTKPMLPEIVDQMPISLDRSNHALNSSGPNISKLGEGLIQAELCCHLDEDMLELFRQARLIWVCFEQIGVHDFTANEKRSLTIQRMNIDHRLLSYAFQESRKLRPVQEACRQALVMYSNAHYNVVQPSSEVARCMVQDLQHVLGATDLASCWDKASRALLWVAFLGAHMSFGQQERPWFVTLLSKVARKSSCDSWSDARQVLLLYYYSDRVFELPFREIWSEVETLAPLLNDWILR